MPISTRPPLRAAQAAAALAGLLVLAPMAWSQGVPTTATWTTAAPAGVARRLLESSEIAEDALVYEHREGQLAMMDAVERALRNDRHLFVEAGTGTGKTLAYLLPALLSGKKVVISTATVARCSPTRSSAPFPMISARSSWRAASACSPSTSFRLPATSSPNG